MIPTYLVLTYLGIMATIRQPLAPRVKEGGCEYVSARDALEEKKKKKRKKERIVVWHLRLEITKLSNMK